MLFPRIFNWVFYGHVWIALAATSLAAVTLEIVFGGQSCVSQSPILLFTFFATLGVYTLHRYLSYQRAGRRPSSQRYGIVAKHPKLSIGIGIGSILVASYYWIYYLSDSWWAIIFAIPLTLFYLTPPFPGWRRLRDLPYLKNLWVAWAWTIMTVLVPIIAIKEEVISFAPSPSEDNLHGLMSLHSCYGGIYTPSNFFHSIIIHFFFTYAVALLFDLRDVTLDQSQGVKTLAGEKPTLHKILVYGSLLLAAFFAAGYMEGCIVGTEPGLVMSATYLLMLPIAYYTYRKTSEDWFAVVVNGLLLLPYLALQLYSILGGDAGAGQGL